MDLSQEIIHKFIISYTLKAKLGIITNYIMIIYYAAHLNINFAKHSIYNILHCVCIMTMHAHVVITSRCNACFYYILLI